MAKYILASLLFFSLVVEGQIAIEFPRERMIYQRNNNNLAEIYITGSFNAEFDSIRARVVERVPGQGTSTLWKKIAERDGKPYFNGSITVSGGWYNLQVVAFKNGNSISFKTVERVGVGEVFVIAGQSNSSGTTSGTQNGMYVAGAGYGIDTNEDRCNVMHYANKTNEYNKFPVGFSQMSGASVGNDSIFIGPFQLASWCWGKLSESLVNTLNVPVLIYGAGFGGTSVKWWKESANGENLTNPAFFVKQEFNHPYGALGGVLKYYASLTGLRAVLWHQGEADHYMTSGEYKFNLEQVIAKSRENIESPTFAWMVARASYAGGPSTSVIGGQDQVIAADANVFAGPETDALGSNYRTDNVHLDKQIAFIDHAALWHTRITTTGFLSSSQPVLAQPFIDLNFTCNTTSPGNPVTLSAIGNYSKYAWSNRNNTQSEALGFASDYGQDYTISPDNSYLRLNWTYDSTNSISSPAGKYALNVRKSSGKILLSPVVDLSMISVPSAPLISSSQSQVRPGSSVLLTGSSCSSTYIWSTSETGSSINPVINSNSTFTAQCKNLHCLSLNSNTVSIVASSCFANALSLSGTINAAEQPYKTQQSLQSVQKIEAGGAINYSANSSIMLNPGFKAEQGSIFKTAIENCF